MQYDDGDEEWVDLGQEKWSWADRAADKRKHARAAGAVRCGRARLGGEGPVRLPSLAGHRLRGSN